MTTTIEDLELEPTADPQPDEQPEHLARCTECAVTVRFRRTASGSGFMILGYSGVDGDVTFGVGPTTIPECPNGHGEMAIADDQLPAAEAFALAQEKLNAPSQPNLPGVVLPFNFQGAYLELEEKALEVDRLHGEYKSAAEEAKDAKKAWDKAAELYTKIALELRRRRKAKEGEPAADLLDESEREPSTNLVRCKWEAKHPGVSCPKCTEARDEVQSAIDSEAHVEEVDAYLDDADIGDVIDALDTIQTIVPLAMIRGWSAEERAEVKAWATSPDPSAHGAPKVLGTCHIAGSGRNGDPQACTMCDAVLIDGGDDPNYYPEGWMVGTNCPGKPKDATHHYPEKKRGRKPKATA
jgi:hypothetical protein